MQYNSMRNLQIQVFYLKFKLTKFLNVICDKSHYHNRLLRSFGWLSYVYSLDFICVSVCLFQRQLMIDQKVEVVVRFVSPAGYHG